jgi:hypothetical protein
MRNAVLIVILFVSGLSFSQKEGQNFCKGTDGGSYFPLDIKMKKIFWYDTYYFEEQLGTKEHNGKTYLEYKQTWKNGSVDLMYLREADSKVLEYEEGLDQENTRFGSQFEEGYSWTRVDKTAVYTILSYDGKLKTPYCIYDKLLVIEAKFKKVIYEFYYLRGLGYIGATQNENLVSYITPEM